MLTKFPFQFIITSYSCPLNSPQPCLDNPVVYKEDVPCTRFKTDDSGPWYMFYEAMSGSHCGEETVKMMLTVLKNLLNISLIPGRI
jgi:hypothetical protein